MTRDVLMARLLAEARARWPGVVVDEEAFARNLQARVDGQPDAAAALAALHTSDLYLAQALAAGDAAAVDCFERTFIADVAGLLVQRGYAPAAIDEARQLVRQRLLAPTDGAPPRIVEYAGRGPLGKWVRIIALRLASNLRRDEQVRAHDSLRDAPAVALGDPELLLVKARYGDAFARAFRAAVGELSPDERNLLRLHFVDGLNIERIGALYDVHRATVARRIAAARQRLHDATVERMQAELKLDGRELQSLLALVRSQADISLRSLLA